MFVGSCIWASQVPGFFGARWPVRAVVFSGWILSLCLHEFGHAVTAYIGGDKTVASKGYLTLDPRKYAHAGLSLALPILFLLMGGIGLPGGAVWINHSLIRSTKMRSLMSFAGPAANFLCAVAISIPLKLGAFESMPTLHVAMAFLALLQITTMLLNLIPFPGLDGFGVLSPFLPNSVLKALAPVRQFGFIALIVLLSTPSIGNTFWNNADRLAALIGVPTELANLGRGFFSFNIFR
jgi:Zn-dependent protease